MIDLECPNCGRVGSIPQSKANERLVCRKCHMVFHMGATGRAVLGEPPGAHAAEHGHGHAHAHAHTTTTAVHSASTGIEWGGLGSLNPGLLAVLAVLLLVGGGILLAALSFSGTATTGSLTAPSQLLAEAMKAGDIERVKQLATVDSAENVTGWFQATNQLLEDLKKAAPGHDVKIQGVVMEENTSAGLGQVILLVMPTHGVARNDQITRDASFSTPKPTEITTYWTFAGGAWRLDGKRTQLEGSTRLRLKARSLRSSPPRPFHEDVFAR